MQLLGQTNLLKDNIIEVTRQNYEDLEMKNTSDSYDQTKQKTLKQVPPEWQIISPNFMICNLFVGEASLVSYINTNFKRRFNYFQDQSQGVKLFYKLIVWMGIILSIFPKTKRKVGQHKYCISGKRVSIPIQQFIQKLSPIITETSGISNFFKLCLETVRGICLIQTILNQEQKKIKDIFPGLENVGQILTEFSQENRQCFKETCQKNQIIDKFTTEGFDQRYGQDHQSFRRILFPHSNELSNLEKLVVQNTIVVLICAETNVKPENQQYLIFETMMETFKDQEYKLNFKQALITKIIDKVQKRTSFCSKIAKWVKKLIK